MIYLDAINIAGIEIPSDSPLFLSILAVHVFVALACVIVGLVAMLSKKQVGRHSKYGSVYYWLLLIVFITATLMAVMRWEQDYYLFIIGLLAFTAASIGRTALRKKWRGWVKLHIAGMGTSYILMLIAFYMDNGKFLPIWKDLPAITYWLLPIVIGVPIIIYTLLRHPLSRNS